MKGDRRREMYRLATLLLPAFVRRRGIPTLRANVEFASIDRPLRTLLVSDAPALGGQDGHQRQSRAGVRSERPTVLLIDADLRRPGIDEIWSCRIPGASPPCCARMTRLLARWYSTRRTRSWTS
jgi:hypothetical protein